MTKPPPLKDLLLVLLLTLLAPLAAKATGVAWDPSNWVSQAWTLSNSNKTATSPNTGAEVEGSGASGSINGAFGTTAIPLNAKTYFEIEVDAVTGSPANSSPYFLQSAYGVGIGEHGITYGNNNAKDEGTVVNPAEYILYQYNQVVVIGAAGSGATGDWIGDPEDDADAGTDGHYPAVNGLKAAPSLWRPHDVIGIAVDRVSTPNTVTFYYNGAATVTSSWNGSAEVLGSGGSYAATITNTYNISGLAGKTIYPCTQTWWLKGPTATINGGATSFSYSIPAGYTALDSTGGSAPAAPTGLTATPGNTQVSLSWTASSGATGYNVERATTSGGPYTVVSSNQSGTTFTNGGLTNGTLYYYVVTALNSSGTSGNSNQASATPTAGGALPSGWTDVDIGGPSPAGSASYSGGIFNVKGGGSNIYYTTDQFNYAYQSETGDQTLITRVTGLTNTNSTAKAALMFRDSTADNAIYVLLDVKPQSGIEFFYRAALGDDATWVAGATTGVTPSTTTPVWIKLVKSGTTYTAYYSTSVTTPSTWTSVGTATVSLSNSTYLTGLEVCSVDNGTLATGTFDNYSVTAAGGIPGAISWFGSGGTNTATTIPLSWTWATGATAFNIRYMVSGGSTWSTISNDGSSSYTLVGLTANTTYEVQVQGTNSAGAGPWTSSVAFTTAN